MEKTIDALQANYVDVFTLIVIIKMMHGKNSALNVLILFPQKGRSQGQWVGARCGHRDRRRRAPGGKWGLQVDKEDALRIKPLLQPWELGWGHPHTTWKIHWKWLWEVSVTVFKDGRLYALCGPVWKKNPLGALLAFGTSALAFLSLKNHQ